MHGISGGGSPGNGRPGSSERSFCDTQFQALRCFANRTHAFSLTLTARDEGYYGSKTEAAIRAFQTQKGINVELGMIERQTLLALDQEMVTLESPRDPAGQVNARDAVPLSSPLPLPSVPGRGPTTQERSLLITLRERYKNKHRNIEVFQLDGRRGYFFRANMAIDVDGSPRAYSPRNEKPALDKVADADHEGGSTTYIQGEVGRNGIMGEGPNKGYYVSNTSQRFNNEMHKTTNFLDAEQIPYVVLPLSLPSAKLGDLAYVIDLRSFEATHAIWGDCGARDICGEASIRVACNLKLNHLGAENGEDEDFFVYGFLLVEPVLS